MWQRHSHRRLPARHATHSGMIRRQLQVGNIHKLNVEDEVGHRWDTRIRRIRAGASTRAVSQLPWNKESTLAADAHTSEALVEPWHHTAETLSHPVALAIPPLPLAILS